jgi:enoyl-CoA hydratase
LQTLSLTVEDGIARVTMIRAAELNTMNRAFWTELITVFEAIDADTSVRAVVIASTGKHFSAGLDLKMAAGSLGGGGDSSDLGRARESFRRHVKHMQDTFTVVDRCRVPVIAVVQGGCIGGGVDFFTIQEINIAIVADVGTLQRIPYLLPQGLIRELCYTGRRFPAAEAAQYGFLNKVADSHEAAIEAGMALAHEIAGKSPLAITGIKQVLNAGRDMTIDQGLEYVAVWNAGMLQGDDVRNAVTAQTSRSVAKFTDLKG